MKTPLVSIIIPVYNKEKYIAETIRSAVDQTWINKEIIVIDDGSTDNSVTIARSFNNSIITVITQTNCGASAARNNGLKHAKGQYIQFLDGDDLLSPDKISAQMALLNYNEEHLSICNTIHFNDGEDYQSLPVVTEWFSKGADSPVDFLLKLYAGKEVMPGYGGMIAVHSWLTPKVIIDKAGLWNPDLNLDDDGEFFCRVVLASKGIKFSPNGVCYYRKFENMASLSAQKSVRALKSMLLAVNAKYANLKQRTDSDLLDTIFARHFWELGLAAYPKYKDISAQAIRQATQLGYRGLKYSTGKLTALLGKLFGWKVLRLMSYYKHGF